MMSELNGLRAHVRLLQAERAEWRRVLDERAALYQKEVDTLKAQLECAEQRIQALGDALSERGAQSP